MVFHLRQCRNDCFIAAGRRRRRGRELDEAGRIWGSAGASPYREGRKFPPRRQVAGPVAFGGRSGDRRAEFSARFGQPWSWPPGELFSTATADYPPPWGTSATSATGATNDVCNTCFICYGRSPAPISCDRNSFSGSPRVSAL